MLFIGAILCPLTTWKIVKETVIYQEICYPLKKNQERLYSNNKKEKQLKKKREKEREKKIHL